MPVPRTDPLINVPMIVPFDAHDRVDHDAVARNVARWLEMPVDSFLVGSVSGEEAYLSEEEKCAVLRTAAQTLNGDRCLLGGIDCPSVTETLRRAERFAEAGAEMVRIRFPRYQETILDYFEQVLPRCAVPVLLMHQCSPDRFGLAGEPAAEPEVLGQIVSMDNVFGYVTDHDLRFEAQVRWHVPADRRFWVCNGSIILQGTLIGCNGTTTAFANLWPAALRELLDLGIAGQFDAGRALQQQVQEIDALMLPYRAAGIKVALNLLGFQGTHPRSPTRPLPEATQRRLEQALRRAGLLDR